MSVIDVASPSLTRTISDVGERPWGIDVSGHGEFWGTPQTAAGDVSVVDLGRHAVTQQIETGGSPWGLEVWTPR